MTFLTYERIVWLKMRMLITCYVIFREQSVQERVQIAQITIPCAVLFSLDSFFPHTVGSDGVVTSIISSSSFSRDFARCCTISRYLLICVFFREMTTAILPTLSSRWCLPEKSSSPGTSELVHFELRMFLDSYPGTREFPRKIWWDGL